MAKDMQRMLVVGAAVLLAAAAAAWGYFESRQSERDHHAVENKVQAIESLIRRHDQGLWAVVESSHGPSASPADHARHTETMNSFERLSHVDGFAMKNVHIDLLQGDSAVVTYEISGTAARVPALRPDAATPLFTVPKRGVMNLQRANGQWVVTGHRVED